MIEHNLKKKNRNTTTPLISSNVHHELNDPPVETLLNYLDTWTKRLFKVVYLFGIPYVLYLLISMAAHMTG
ncbi:hypothetical protein [Evansella halocellulosilytica]|uniref:hypothetical protein n=1 Tax=Evansella halocellulosilytica TaxID=2011013 RepID=UPI001155B4C6|nr:hypothetical protein [Evansella halocellulosilytica]